MKPTDIASLLHEAKPGYIEDISKAKEAKRVEKGSAPAPKKASGPVTSQKLGSSFGTQDGTLWHVYAHGDKAQRLGGIVRAESSSEAKEKAVKAWGESPDGIQVVKAEAKNAKGEPITYHIWVK